MLAEILANVQNSAVADFLRGSRWVYPLLNATHIASIGILIGAILTYDLHMLGVLAKQVSRRDAAHLLLPVASSGLACALITGPLLFSVKAVEYASNTAFQVKLGLVTFGLLNIAYIGVRPTHTRLAAIISISVWLSALVAGRLIAFV